MIKLFIRMERKRVFYKNFAKVKPGRPPDGAARRGIILGGPRAAGRPPARAGQGRRNRWNSPLKSAKRCLSVICQSVSGAENSEKPCPLAEAPPVRRYPRSALNGSRRLKSGGCHIV